MSTLVLKIREGCEQPYVEFHVDGEDLGARIMAAFGDEGFDDVLPWSGGDYGIEDTVLADNAGRRACAAAAAQRLTLCRTCHQPSRAGFRSTIRRSIVWRRGRRPGSVRSVVRESLGTRAARDAFRIALHAAVA